MTISLQLSLDGAEKENVKAVLLRQSGKEVGRWGENGSDLDSSIDVDAVVTQVTVFYANGSKDNGSIDPDSDGYVIIEANGSGNTQIDYSLPVD
ncbi:MAG: hypothetical protein CMN56_15240 [Sneathiella sp.]|uniref:hypothetical protein n=1 Tax=Sneathiella sp. TaxID=1964365 RepID=UPI000C624995|nr:hypothetical protein [Sneathiella sp.]MAZ04487.1 hypothetical protein [Sneathiella sp.]|tara:strand:- start:20 stop:301 length:282 start_codon:yes stop_codon:yes gene_type:complete